MTDISDERLAELLAMERPLSAVIGDPLNAFGQHIRDCKLALRELQRRRIEMEALQLKNIGLQESLDGCAKRVAAQRAELNAAKADTRRLEKVAALSSISVRRGGGAPITLAALRSMLDAVRP